MTTLHNYGSLYWHCKILD
jgi:hypothetical protein